MKRFITAILVIAIAMTGFAKTQKSSVPKDRLMTLISEYSGKEGFEVVKIGSFGTEALKTFMRLSVSDDDSEEAQIILKAMKGIRKMAIVEYDKCNEKTRDSFNSKLEKALSSSELLIEAKDGSDAMKIYGIYNEDENTIHDFVMFAPNDCALICLLGSIPLDSINELAGK